MQSWHWVAALHLPRHVPRALWFSLRGYLVTAEALGSVLCRSSRVWKQQYIIRWEAWLLLTR